MKRWLLLMLTVLSVQLPNINCSPVPEPPTVFYLHPEPDKTSVSSYTTISATFSRAPQVVELTTEPHIELAHVSRYTSDNEEAKFVFYPKNRLVVNTTYNATLLYGPENGPSSTASWQFTTVEEPRPPTMFQSPKGTDVPIDTQITVNLWRRGASAAEDAELIMKPFVDIDKLPVAEQEPPPLSTTLTFCPTRRLTPNTTYTVIFTLGEKKSCLVWQFTTISE